MTACTHETWDLVRSSLWWRWSPPSRRRRCTSWRWSWVPSLAVVIPGWICHWGKAYWAWKACKCSRCCWCERRQRGRGGHRGTGCPRRCCRCRWAPRSDSVETLKQSVTPHLTTWLGVGPINTRYMYQNNRFSHFTSWCTIGFLHGVSTLRTTWCTWLQRNIQNCLLVLNLGLFVLTVIFIEQVQLDMADNAQWKLKIMIYQWRPRWNPVRKVSCK